MFAPSVRSVHDPPVDMPAGWSIKWGGAVPGYLTWTWVGTEAAGGPRLTGEPAEFLRLIRMASLPACKNCNTTHRDRFVNLGDGAAVMALARCLLARAGVGDVVVE